MSLYLRRLVSGKKARYRDDQLNLELDLAYVTDQVIVMGFPAVGVESFYRNHRADVQRFLSARHGADFWVFNFCPSRENAYHESVFDRRVSRYPFPDHHVPPFLYLQLVTQEMQSWLSGSDARVAVLHCKAGKGRSGTLACAYLLSRASPAPPLSNPVHDSLADWSLIGEKEGLQTPSSHMPVLLPAPVDRPHARSASVPSGPDLSRISSEPVANTLEQVLDLHTARRMKPSLRPSRYQPGASKKSKMGVSIPSQQRWLFYWSQALAGNGPPSLRPCPPEGRETTLDKMTKVKLTKLTVRMRGPSRIQPHVVQAASVVMTSAGKSRATSESTAGKLWASLARYDDRLVGELERWENELRTTGAAIHPSPFKSDQWDSAKMINTFAQMGVSDIQTTQQDEGRSVLTYLLCPLNGPEADQVTLGEPLPESSCTSTSEGSYTFVSSPTREDDAEDPPGIPLEANRELRIKLFIGEVVLGWVWLIPAFHMSPGSPSSSVVISSDGVDFAIGIGKALVDLKISFTHQKCDWGQGGLGSLACLPHRSHRLFGSLDANEP